MKKVCFEFGLRARRTTVSGIGEAIRHVKLPQIYEAGISLKFVEINELNLPCLLSVKTGMFPSFT